jgi:hypothetical protein
VSKFTGSLPYEFPFGRKADGNVDGGSMSRRIIFIPAMLAILVIVSTARSGGAEPATDDCIAKPNSAPPQGSLWYYRVDRAANRRCWAPKA